MTRAVTNGSAAEFGTGSCILSIVAFVAWLAIYVVLAIWITRDAKRRHSPNAALVTVLAWIPGLTVIGLIVHLLTRPKLFPNS
jgi:ABC-type proline/glycine betaine transport system permease subunit